MQTAIGCTFLARRQSI